MSILVCGTIFLLIGRPFQEYRKMHIFLASIYFDVRKSRSFHCNDVPLMWSWQYLSKTCYYCLWSKVYLRGFYYNAIKNKALLYESLRFGRPFQRIVLVVRLSAKLLAAFLAMALCTPSITAAKEECCCYGNLREAVSFNLASSAALFLWELVSLIVELDK